LTSRGRRFRHHHAAAHTDRGENHDPTGTLITAQALNGGLDHPARNKRTVPWQAIEDYRFEKRIKTESEALRKLIEAGLKAEQRPT
jgi:hypothetical protein